MNNDLRDKLAFALNHMPMYDVTYEYLTAALEIHDKENEYEKYDIDRVDDGTGGMRITVCSDCGRQSGHTTECRYNPGGRTDPDCPVCGGIVAWCDACGSDPLR